MASRDEAEREMEKTVASAFRSWLAKARDAVMAPWRASKIQPDPVAIFSTEAAWSDEVKTIGTQLGRIADRAWNEVANSPSVSRHAFVMSQLAQTENFLVRIPNDTYNLIFAEIADGVNGGESVDQIAHRVDDALTYDGRENWPARARTIAQTEVNRAMNAGIQGAGTEIARVTGTTPTKTWLAHHDEKTRVAHHGADGQQVPFYSPFDVGGEPLMFPGDPMGSPGNVINCRCSMVMKGAARG